MKNIVALFFSFMFIVSTAEACGIGKVVDVRILTDRGVTLPTYPVIIKRGISKAYTEAVKGDHYQITVKNRLDCRVGLVIAVDGRNIITGKKSWLNNNERMYILEPHGSGEFAGWRTSKDIIKRFYFTDVPNSYASSFGDESAMGVIAVAVYPEAQRYSPPVSRPYHPLENDHENSPEGTSDRSHAKEVAPSSSHNILEREASQVGQAVESAGTGYGHGAYSPSRIVAFEPVHHALEKIYLKYEWRSTLCQLGIITCEQPHFRTPNRFWNDYGYCPPPPAKIEP